MGTSHTVTATLTDSAGGPVGDAPIEFTVAGANPGDGTDVTDESGQATFTYTGNNVGTDQIGACYDADDQLPCEAVGSAEKVWQIPVGLSVSSSLDPTTVSAGDDVLDTATITATGSGIAHAVTATISAAGSNGTAKSATVSQGSCGAPSGGQVTCTIGNLAAGSPRRSTRCSRLPRRCPRAATSTSPRRRTRPTSHLPV